jgi:hypothetical protein
MELVLLRSIGTDDETKRSPPGIKLELVRGFLNSGRTGLLRATWLFAAPALDASDSSNREPVTRCRILAATYSPSSEWLHLKVQK